MPGILSYADASLISGSGSATSMSFFLVVVITVKGVSDRRCYQKSSRRPTSAPQQLIEVVVHARNAEVRLALEWATQVVDTMRVPLHELNDRQDKVIRLVE